MADDLDIASEREQLARDKAVTAIQNKPLSAIATGQCLECSIAVGSGIRWCDSDCRDDWQRWNPGA